VNFKANRVFTLPVDEMLNFSIGKSSNEDKSALNAGNLVVTEHTIGSFDTKLLFKSEKEFDQVTSVQENFLKGCKW
jgi:hypothetical protein